MNSPAHQSAATPSRSLARRLGLFDATMLVMGGMVGSGIFINPYVVAQRVHTPVLVLGAWAAGGVLALLAAFIWAELADRMPQVGGQYAYLRDTYHPLIAFLYGWVLLLVIQTGGMAAVTVTASKYLLELTKLPFAEWQVAVFIISVLTAVNCLGVRAGGTVQTALMVLKIVTITLLVGAGIYLLPGKHITWRPAFDQPMSSGLLAAFGTAMVPVIFAYGGWQTASFVAGEMKQPQRDLPRAMVLGIVGVAIAYTSVNYVCVRALGVAALGNTTTPASSLMRMAMGERGATIIAAGIVISTIGFLSHGVLVAPRVYFAMAEDGVFFRQLAWVHPKTRVPVLAILLQSVWTIVIMLSGSYEKILNYVTSMDAIFWTLTAGCLFLLRRKTPSTNFRSPGHPITTAIFCASCLAVTITTVYQFPGNTLIGIAILAAGIPMYYIWRRTQRT